MRYGYTVAQIRDAEARAMAVVGPDALMQRAAAGLASAILRRLGRPSTAERLRSGQTLQRRVERLTGTGAFGAYGARVLLVVGSGNNGGDALFAGAILARRGARVSAWRTATTVHEAGWRAFLAAGGRDLDAADALAALPRQHAVVDGVAGIGSRPGLTPEVAAFASACREHGVPVVAVDLPSGLAPEPPFTDDPHFIAALTVTFGGHKPCQLMEPARSDCGEVELVELGLDLGEPVLAQWEVPDLAAAWPVPDARSDKYSRGVVGLDTGSVDYPGAAVLSAAGAVGAGAGMVRYLGAPQVAGRILDRFPNVIAGQGRVQALVLGSGWGDRKDRGVVGRAVDAGVPLVVDADGLRHLPAQGHRGVLLTPHAGELARLLDVPRSEVEADPLAAVRAAVDATGCTVLLKGATQYVATPGESLVRLAMQGPGWTAQAGSGDVLAGACGALLAAGLGPLEAALAAASIQALTAELLPGPLPPQDAAAEFRRAIRELAQN
ncbi:MAG: bifunctional ADP-dependent NAD(P)H-hydrate dehydratase/NAD(P)H-hydrate epimerase [Actinobacteria bacterium]|nr:bifunctional ADP-dependent NAD(P)H-hydrate dehydratase/NAD(P)H-hydrate epimerase [Actinomycetota bacterium]